MRRSAAGALWAVALFLSAPAARPQAEVRKNDAFLPVAEEAESLLADGDLLLLRARSKESAGELSDSELRAVLEAWRRALTSALDSESSRFEGVPCAVAPAEAATEEELALLEELREDSMNGPDRRLEARTEHVTVAVQRRLSALSSAERAAWTERFTPLADAELQAAGTPGRLRRIEAEFPQTQAASRAALRLADLAFEVGHREETHAWLKRAARHAAEKSPLLDEAIRKRRALLDDLFAVRPTPVASWETASRLTFVDAIDLGLRRTRFQDARLGFSRGVLPGTIVLEGGILAIQFPDAVLLLEEGRTRALFDPRALLDEFENVRVGPSFAPAGSAWPLRPAATPEGDLVLVLGRALAGGSSCLVRVTPPSPALTVDATDLELAPELVWAVTPRGRLARGASGKIALRRSALPEGLWEFQPGPLFSDGQILCQARRWDTGDNDEPLDLARPEAWLLAFDAHDGDLLASRFIAKGTDVHRDPGRFQEARVITPAQPPARVPGGVLCGTGIGVAALLGAGDLRVEWTLLLGRRDPDDAGWAAFEAPPVIADERIPHALLGAAESDRLYALRLDADVEDRGLFVHDPQPIGEARALVAADAEGYLTLGLRGARRTMFRMEWTEDEPRRIDAVDARADERLRGSGLASDSRAYLATDKTLYLFDRTAELRLVETIPLPLGGGTLSASGDLVYVASDGGITILRAE